MRMEQHPDGRKSCGGIYTRDTNRVQKVPKGSKRFQKVPKGSRESKVSRALQRFQEVKKNLTERTADRLHRAVLKRRRASRRTSVVSPSFRVLALLRIVLRHMESWWDGRGC